jgi:hypothetical protein
MTGRCKIDIPLFFTYLGLVPLRVNAEISMAKAIRLIEMEVRLALTVIRKR